MTLTPGLTLLGLAAHRARRSRSRSASAPLVIGIVALVYGLRRAAPAAWPRADRDREPIGSGPSGEAAGRPPEPSSLTPSA